MTDTVFFRQQPVTFVVATRIGDFLLQCMSLLMAHSVNSDSYLEWSLSEA